MSHGENDIKIRKKWQPCKGKKLKARNIACKHIGFHKPSLCKITTVVISLWMLISMPFPPLLFRKVLLEFEDVFPFFREMWLKKISRFFEPLEYMYNFINDIIRNSHYFLSTFSHLPSAFRLYTLLLRWGNTVLAGSGCCI